MNPNKTLKTTEYYIEKIYVTSQRLSYKILV